jgi:hypothetical protein
LDRVARIFDCLRWHYGGGKLPIQIDQVNSGIASTPMRTIEFVHGGDGCFAATNLTAESTEAIISSLSLGDARLCFLVKKIFGRDENKISNKVHFFLVGFKSGF